MYKDGMPGLSGRQYTDLQLQFMPDVALHALVATVPVYLYCVEYQHGMPVSTFHSPYCEAITGFKPFEYQTDSGLWLNMIHADDRERVRSLFSKLKGNGAGMEGGGHYVGEPPAGPTHPRTIEHRILNKRGEVRWVANRYLATRNGEGDLVRLDGVVLDITDQKRTEAEILRRLDREARLAYDLAHEKKKAEEALEQNDKFVSLVSHDLRSPIATIIGLLKLWPRDDHNPWKENPQTLVNRMVGIGEYMLNMIDDLLNLTRLKQGGIKPNQRFFDLSMAVRGVVDNNVPHAEMKGIALMSAVPPLTRVHADQRLVSEMVHNLISNAVKFCRAGDTITVGVQSGQNVTLVVQDTGPGLNPAFLPDLFRYDVTTTSNGSAGERGTGFGLPYCGEVMRLHNGRIWVESEPGIGARFIAEFPGKKPAVLVVDDEDDRRYLVAEMLKPLVVEIVTARNGAEALEIMRRQAVHLVISDIKMPVMDGLDLLAKLRADPQLKDLPVIVLTSSAEKAANDRVLQMGANDFLRWPADGDDLLTRIRRFVV